MRTDDPGTSDGPNELDRDQAAFLATAAARDALPREQVVRYTLDAMYASGRALRIARTLRPFRADLAGLPGFDVGHLDGFEGLGRALRFCHVEVMRRVRRPPDLPALAEEGFRLRGLLLTYLDLLSRKGTVPPALVAKLRSGTGYRDLAEDLTVVALELASLTTLPAGAFGPGAPVEYADVARGAEIADGILRRIGATEVDLPKEALVDARARLGTLLLRSHAQLRRGMDYLRFEQGDAATLVPSLFVPTGPRRRARGAADGNG